MQFPLRLGELLPGPLSFRTRLASSAVFDDLLLYKPQVSSALCLCSAPWAVLLLLVKQSEALHCWRHGRWDRRPKLHLGVSVFKRVMTT